MCVLTPPCVHSFQNANGNQVVTARQLQSILRMSQALARLRLDDYVAMVRRVLS